MRWLSGPSPSAVTEALRAIVPELSGLPVDLPDPAGRDDPVWQSSSAALGEDFFVKFAWSETAARRVLRQIRVLDALAREPAVPYLPQVVAKRHRPADHGHEARARSEPVRGRGLHRPGSCR